MAHTLINKKAKKEGKIGAAHAIQRGTQQALRRMQWCGRRGADRESGDLADGLAPSLRDDPSIALERARARMRQGDMKRARAALEEADRSLATPGQQLVFSLEDASLLILERSAIRPACEAAQAAISVAHGQSDRRGGLGRSTTRLRTHSTERSRFS